jgi:hypothetical protein
MKEGRINVIAGWLFLLLGLIMGAFLLYKLGDPAWAAKHDAMPRAIFRVVHFHGSLFAIVNIIYGLTIKETTLSSGVKTIGSWLAILAMILYPLNLFVAAFYPVLFNLVPLGGLSLIIAVAIMVYGQVFARAS